MEQLKNFAPSMRRWANYALATVGFLFAVICFVSVVFGLYYSDNLGIAYVLWCGLLTVTVPVTVVVRHRHGGFSVWLALLAIVFSLVPLPMVSTWWALPVLTYHAGKHFQRKPRILVLAMSEVLALLMGRGFTTIMLAEADYARSDFLQLWILNGSLCMVFTALTWTWGTTSRLRALRSQELEERAQRLEFEREQERSLAAVDERSRIAREMHDVVAHSLSVIVMQSDGARYAAQANNDLGTALKGLEQIGQVAREALHQTRGVLGLLRSSAETEMAPLPTLADLPSLVEVTRVAGLKVEFEGTGGTPAGELATGVQLAAYRVVQEALTNVRKHAPGAAVKVFANYDRTGVTVEVLNDSSPKSSITRLPGTGKGLVGMQERVALYHGNLTAAPLFTGGFQVKAFFPYSDT